MDGLSEVPDNSFSKGLSEFITGIMKGVVVTCPPNLAKVMFRNNALQFMGVSVARSRRGVML